MTLTPALRLRGNVIVRSGDFAFCQQHVLGNFSTSLLSALLDTFEGDDERLVEEIYQLMETLEREDEKEDLLTALSKLLDAPTATKAAKQPTR